MTPARQEAEEQAKVARLEGEKATLVDAVQHAIDRGVGVGWELQPIVANLASPVAPEEEK